MRCRHVSLVFTFALGTLALLARPASAAGFDLRWGVCAADGGASNENFACNTDVGQSTLVGGFRLDAPLSQVAVVEVVLDLIVAGDQTVPDWWDFGLTGGCRTGSLSADATIGPGAVNCADWSSGQGFAGVIGYDNTGTIAGPDRNSHRRVKLAATMDVPHANLAANQDYFLFNLNIDYFMTVDTGSGDCPGCTIPVCIVLNSLRLTTASSTVTTLTTPNAPGSNFATWQGGAGASCAAVPVKRSTWSGVKALYR